MPGVGPPDQHAALPVNSDGLRAADGPAGRLNLEAAPFQFGADAGADGFLGLDRRCSGQRKEARQVNGGLKIETAS